MSNFKNWELTSDFIENHGSGCVYQSAEMEKGGIKYTGTAVLQDGEIMDVIDIEEEATNG